MCDFAGIVTSDGDANRTAHALHSVITAAQTSDFWAPTAPEHVAPDIALLQDTLVSATSYDVDGDVDTNASTSKSLNRTQSVAVDTSEEELWASETIKLQRASTGFGFSFHAAQYVPLLAWCPTFPHDVISSSFFCFFFGVSMTLT